MPPIGDPEFLPLFAEIPPQRGARPRSREKGLDSAASAAYLHNQLVMD
jgi:hypothetical protein